MNPRPADYLEFNYEAVTICMNRTKQVVIITERVGDTFHFYNYETDRDAERTIVSNDGPVGLYRSWVEAPLPSRKFGPYTYYGTAIKEARLACGWVDPEEEKFKVWLEDMKEDARHATDTGYRRRG